MEGRFTTWLLLLASAALISHAAAEGNVRVGAILDLASVAGTRYQTSIRMAVEDYYSGRSLQLDHGNRAAFQGLVQRCRWGRLCR
jgi:hypothetical protein